MVYSKIVRNLIEQPLDVNKHYHVYKILTTKQNLAQGLVSLQATNEQTYQIDLSSEVDKLMDGDCIIDDGHNIVALYFEE